MSCHGKQVYNQFARHKAGYYGMRPGDVLSEVEGFTPDKEATIVKKR